MTPTFFARFPKQLGHWTIHGICNALPSFIIAMILLGLRTPVAILAMLSAVAVFVLAFAVVTSLPGPLSEESQVLGRAIRLGARIRSWMAGLSLLFFPFGESTFFFTPDFWCGWLAVMIQGEMEKWFGIQGFALRPLDETGDASVRFLPVFTTTLLEGFIISFLLLMISFFCVIFLQARESRRMLKASRLGWN